MNTSKRARALEAAVMVAGAIAAITVWSLVWSTQATGTEDPPPTTFEGGVEIEVPADIEKAAGELPEIETGPDRLAMSPGGAQ